MQLGRRPVRACMRWVVQSMPQEARAAAVQRAPWHGRPFSPPAAVHGRGLPLRLGGAAGRLRFAHSVGCAVPPSECWAPRASCSSSARSCRCSSSAEPGGEAGQPGMRAVRQAQGGRCMQQHRKQARLGWAGLAGCCGDPRCDAGGSTLCLCARTAPARPWQHAASHAAPAQQTGTEELAGSTHQGAAAAPNPSPPARCPAVLHAAFAFAALPGPSRSAASQTAHPTSGG